MGIFATSQMNSNLLALFLCVIVAQLDISSGFATDPFLHRLEAGDMGRLRHWDYTYEIYDHVELLVYTRNDERLQGTSETYDYYTLPFCYPFPDYPLKPGEKVWDDHELAKTSYKILFRVDIPYKALCHHTFSAGDLSKLRTTIARDYQFEMMLDDRPLEAPFGKSENVTRKGKTATVYYHFPHIHFDLSYVGNRVADVKLSTDPARAVDISAGDYLTVGYSYSVTWREAVIPPEYRDPEPEEKLYTIFPPAPEGALYMGVYIRVLVDWFAITNPFIIMLLLAGVLAMILMCSLKERFVKRVHDEAEKWLPGSTASRFPTLLSLFCACVGTGTQLLIMAIAILFLALMGFSTFDNRVALLITCLGLYPASAACAGYVAAAEYKIMCGKHWEQAVIKTTAPFSAPIMVMFIFLNSVAFGYRSTTAVSAGGIGLLVVWVTLTWLSTELGAIKGDNTKVVARGLLPGDITKQVGKTPCYRRTLPQMLLAGIFGFYSVCNQFIDSLFAVWGLKVYINYPVLSIVFIFLVIVTAFITVILTYFQLAAGDNRWWWRSFLCGGSTGLFMFGFSVLFYYIVTNFGSNLEIFFFFGYMMMVCYAFFLMLGAVGYWASLIFNQYIYKDALAKSKKKQLGRPRLAHMA